MRAYVFSVARCLATVNNTNSSLLSREITNATTSPILTNSSKKEEKQGMEDEWNLSVEELDSLEQDALKQLANRQKSSQTATVSATSTCVPSQPKRVIPSTLISSPKKSDNQVYVKIFKDGPGRIALETQYNPDLVAMLKSVAGHEWDQLRRLWTYPENELESVEKALCSLPHIVANIHAVPPLSLTSNCRVADYGIGTHGFFCNKGRSISEKRNPETFEPIHHYDSSKSSPCKPLETSDGHISESPQSQKNIIVVQLYLIDQDRIAARSIYNERVKEACQSVQGRLWNAEEKVWTFPKNKLGELLNSLDNISSPSINVEALPPLVLPDSWWSRIPSITPSVRTKLWEEADQAQEGDLKKNLQSCYVNLFLHASGCIAAKFQYQERVVAAFRTIPRAEWNAKERLWMFPISFLGEAERTLCKLDALEVVVESLDPFVRHALEAAASFCDLRGMYSNMPACLENVLMPFQRDGVRFVLEHGGRALIADEMGLGKTLQAIAVASCLKDAWPVLVVTPSSLRLQWALMIHQWLQICSSEISIVIADESHYLKNAQAKRTDACIPLLQKAQYCILLTGTPALSRPIELFKQLQALHPTVYNNVHHYGQRYCKGGYFGVYQGASNHEELHALMKTTVMIRRLKKDVLSQLPVKRRQRILLSMKEKGLQQMRALFFELGIIKQKMKVCKSDEEAQSIKWTQQQLINKIYTESAEVKIPAVLEYLQTIIEGGCKFLVFAHHLSMLDAIEQFLLKKKVGCIRIDGSTPSSSRQALVTQFQEKEEVKVAVLAIRAAGVGLTLTAASTVIFAELSWTPGDIVQAEDRAHRIGQVASVNVYYLHANETVDDLIWEAVQHKLENLGQVLDGQENALEASSDLCHNLPKGQKRLDSFMQPCNNNYFISNSSDLDLEGDKDSSDTSRAHKKVKN